MAITDGGTTRIGKERIRLVGFDTPEVFSPGCAEEKALGDKVTDYLAKLLSSGTVTIERVDLAVYKRTLGIVRVGGPDVARFMIEEALTRPQRPADGWCD